MEKKLKKALHRHNFKLLQRLDRWIPYFEPSSPGYEKDGVVLGPFVRGYVLRGGREGGGGSGAQEASPLPQGAPRGGGRRDHSPPARHRRPKAGLAFQLSGN